MIKQFKNWTPVNRRFLVAGLSLTMLLQVTILATEYLSSVWPLWFGTPITLKTAPVDPRSLFRGNYVRLNYDISTISSLDTFQTFKDGEIIYVTLKKDDEYLVATSLHRDKPLSGIFIRGRIAHATAGGYRIKYGIEAYFMPKEKALKAQHSLREGALAVIYLLGNGKAAIAQLHCKSGDC